MRCCRSSWFLFSLSVRLEGAYYSLSCCLFRTLLWTFKCSYLMLNFCCLTHHALSSRKTLLQQIPAMKPIELAVGLLNLVGFLKNIIDPFEYIQLTEYFGTTFQSSLLKLNIERLPFSRWVKAMGTNSDVIICSHQRQLRNQGMKWRKLSNYS